MGDLERWTQYEVNWGKWPLLVLNLRMYQKSCLRGETSKLRRIVLQLRGRRRPISVSLRPIWSTMWAVDQIAPKTTEKSCLQTSNNPGFFLIVKECSCDQWIIKKIHTKTKHMHEKIRQEKNNILKIIAYNFVRSLLSSHLFFHYGN